MLRALRATALSMAFVTSAWSAEVILIPPAEKGALVQKGAAAFYADKFHGRRTASGEIMDQNALTAASLSLPLGTYVTVTSLETGRRVQVRINDRGPHAQGRIIDLSRAAAQALGISPRHGVAPVRVEANPADQPSDELRKQIAARVRVR